MNLNAFIDQMDYKANILLPNEISEAIHRNTEHFFYKHAMVLKVKDQNYVECAINDKEFKCSWDNDGSHNISSSNIKIFTHELSTKFKITRNIFMNNLININDMLIDQISQSFISSEIQAFLYGDGQKQPFGLLKDNDNVQIINHQLVEDNTRNMIQKTILSMFIKMPAQHVKNSIWLINRKFLKDILYLEWGKGIFTYINHKDSMKMQILGLDAFVVDELDDNHQCILVNLKQSYYILENQDFYLVKDPFSSKPDIDLFISKKIGGTWIKNNVPVILLKNE